MVIAKKREEGGEVQSFGDNGGNDQFAKLKAFKNKKEAEERELLMADMEVEQKRLSDLLEDIDNAKRDGGINKEDVKKINEFVDSDYEEKFYSDEVLPSFELLNEFKVYIKKIEEAYNEVLNSKKDVEKEEPEIEVAPNGGSGEGDETKDKGDDQIIPSENKEPNPVETKEEPVSKKPEPTPKKEKSGGLGFALKAIETIKQSKLEGLENKKEDLRKIKDPEEIQREMRKWRVRISPNIIEKLSAEEKKEMYQARELANREVEKVLQRIFKGETGKEKTERIKKSIDEAKQSRLAEIKNIEIHRDEKINEEFKKLRINFERVGAEKISDKDLQEIKAHIRLVNAEILEKIKERREQIKEVKKAKAEAKKKKAEEKKPVAIKETSTKKEEPVKETVVKSGELKNPEPTKKIADEIIEKYHPTGKSENEGKIDISETEFDEMANDLFEEIGLELGKYEPGSYGYNRLAYLQLDILNLRDNQNINLEEKVEKLNTYENLFARYSEKNELETGEKGEGPKILSAEEAKERYKEKKGEDEGEGETTEKQREFENFVEKLIDARKRYVEMDYDMDKKATLFQKVFKIGKRDLGEFGQEYERVKNEYQDYLRKYKDLLMGVASNDPQSVEGILKWVIIDEGLKCADIRNQIEVDNAGWSRNILDKYSELNNKYRRLSFGRKLTIGVMLAGFGFATSVAGGAVAAGGIATMSLARIFSVGVSITGFKAMLDGIDNKSDKSAVKEAIDFSKSEGEKIDFETINNILDKKINRIDKDLQEAKQLKVIKTFTAVGLGVAFSVLGHYVGKEVMDYFRGGEATIAPSEAVPESSEKIADIPAEISPKDVGSEVNVAEKLGYDTKPMDFNDTNIDAVKEQVMETRTGMPGTAEDFDSGKAYTSGGEIETGENLTEEVSGVDITPEAETDIVLSADGTELVKNIQNEISKNNSEIWEKIKGMTYDEVKNEMPELREKLYGVGNKYTSRFSMRANAGEGETLDHWIKRLAQMVEER